MGKPSASASADERVSEEAAMASLERHKEAFDLIIQRYALSEDAKASEIADFLTQTAGETRVSAEQFAAKFGMSASEARIFLSWIHVGIKFKEESNLNAHILSNH
mmetsp:Transcript_13800/g.37048  ORF Transcript_13800/g.37048 Transcript_13800/m.37048 type:complete len:105 (+) Transcript_13800:1017-1331(+)